MVLIQANPSRIQSRSKKKPKGLQMGPSEPILGPRWYQVETEMVSRRVQVDPSTIQDGAKEKPV